MSKAVLYIIFSFLLISGVFALTTQDSVITMLDPLAGSTLFVGDNKVISFSVINGSETFPFVGLTITSETTQTVFDSEELILVDSEQNVWQTSAPILFNNSDDYILTVFAHDSNMHVTRAEFKLSVIEEDGALVLDYIEDLFTVEGKLVKIEPHAVNLDATSIYYNFTSPLDENGTWQTKEGDAKFNTYWNVTPKEYRIVVTAYDNMGNIDYQRVKITVAPAKFPTVKITSPVSYSWHQDDFSVNFTAYDDLSGIVLCDYRFKNTGSQPRYGPYTKFNCTQGMNTLSVAVPVGLSETCNAEGRGSCLVAIGAYDASGKRSSSAWRVFSVDYEAPIANNDEIFGNEDKTLFIDVLANDISASPLNISEVTLPKHGTLIVNGGKNITYIPFADWAGVDYFNYTIVDVFGESATARVRVGIVPIPDAPVLDHIDDIVVTEGDLIQIVPSAYDPDDEPLTFTYTSPLDENGTWQTKEGDANISRYWEYGPKDYFITITVLDGAGESDSQEVIITVNPAQAPIVTIISPGTNSWQTGDFNLTFSVSDDLSEVVSCGYQIKNSGEPNGAYTPFVCSGGMWSINVPVGVEEECSVLGKRTCIVSIGAFDASGKRSLSTWRVFSIDYQPLGIDNILTVIEQRVANITIVANSSVSSLIRYGNQSENLTHIVESNETNLTHVFSLEGLEPATKYYYEISIFAADGREFTTEKYEFTTGSIVPEIVSGDNGGGGYVPTQVIRASVESSPLSGENIPETVEVVPRTTEETASVQPQAENVGAEGGNSITGAAVANDSGGSDFTTWALIAIVVLLAVVLAALFIVRKNKKKH